MMDGMKKKLGGINVLYPTPTTIVGAIVAVKKRTNPTYLEFFTATWQKRP